MVQTNQTRTEDSQSHGLLMGLVAAKFVCCGGLILLATGGLAGLGAWFSGIDLLPIGYIALAATVTVIALAWRHTVRRRDVRDRIRLELDGERE